MGLLGRLGLIDVPVGSNEDGDGVGDPDETLGGALGVVVGDPDETLGGSIGESVGDFVGFFCGYLPKTEAIFP